MIDRREFIGMTMGAGMLAAEPAAPYRIIDPHVHVWRADPAFPWAKETANPPKKDASPEMLLDLMKANGVSKTVIIQVIHYRYDHSFLAAVLKQYPQYFRGVARVDPLDPAAPDHLSRLVRIQEKFPETTLVIDHMADCPVDAPQELEKLIAFKRFPTAFVKVSHAWQISKQPYPFADAQEFVKRLHAAFGPKQLMWATDWPIVEQHHTTYAQALTLVKNDMKFLNDEDKRWMLSKTIERVWPFD